ncbi:MAG: 50S ribosomal protein L24 [Candidatus Micrarchaeia archaeon]
MKFSKKMSKQPRKKRRLAYNAPLHKKRKNLSAHLSKDLKAKLGKRSLIIKTGDKVKILRGQFKSSSGKVSKVETFSSKIFVEKIIAKKQSGKEVQVGITPSNVVITEAAEREQKKKQKG